MECNCNNNNSNGGVIPWVRGNRLPLIICVYENVVTQEQVGDSTLTVNEMTRVPYTIQDNDTVTVIMKSGFRQVEMPFTTDGNKVMVTDNGELPTGAYTVEVTIERGDGARGRWQETRQVRIYENTSDAQLGEMYSIDADLFFYAKGDTGTGIADITNNPDGTLTITMTDGTSYTTEALKGDKGDKGDTGERGVSIVSFDVTGQTDVSVIYTVTFSDDTTQDISVPKGPQGDTGLTGNGISSTTLNSDYTLTIAYTDGTTYTTPSIRGAQGAQGVSVIGFTQTGETATNTMYNLVFSDGRTQSVAIPKGTKGDKGDTGNTGAQGAQGVSVIGFTQTGETATNTMYNLVFSDGRTQSVAIPKGTKGDKGDTGNTGAQGAQGPKGDTVTATDYTLYNVQGSSSEGAMSQDATTKAISAQTGYYTCGTAAGTPEKVVTVESGNLYKRTLGGHFKVKMTNANTASGVTLQIGSETAAALWYNGAAASATNTWDAGEVISVYYDGTYYQASNAQGGGGAGKKELTGVSGTVYNTAGDRIGTPTTGVSNFIGTKYPVSAGDVVAVSGTGGGNARLWAIAGTKEGNEYDDNILDREDESTTRKDKVLVMPENAHWVVLNSTTSNAEWYFAKAGSVGAHEMLTEDYLYGGLRALAVGQTYEVDDAVKTTNKQLRRITKEIKSLSLSETLASGNIRTSGNNTYRAASAVSTYNPNPSTPYSAGAYALGSMTEYTLTITADTVTAGNITVNGTEVAIESTDDADAIASKIASALVIDGWTDSASENVVTVRCNTIGNNTTTITIGVGDTGVVVSGNSTPSVAGTSVIRKYDGETWTNAIVAGMVTDGVLVSVDEAWLITNATQQNSVTQDIKKDLTIVVSDTLVEQYKDRINSATGGSSQLNLVWGNRHNVANIINGIYWRCHGSATTLSVYKIKSGSSILLKQFRKDNTWVAGQWVKLYFDNPVDLSGGYFIGVYGYVYYGTISGVGLQFYCNTSGGSWKIDNNIAIGFYTFYEKSRLAEIEDSIEDKQNQINEINEDIDFVIDKTYYENRLSTVGRTNNYYVSVENGQAVYRYLANFYYTGFIYVGDCSSIKIPACHSWGCVFFDANKQYNGHNKYTSTDINTPVTVDVPENTSYVQVNIKTSDAQYVYCYLSEVKRELSPNLKIRTSQVIDRNGQDLILPLDRIITEPSGGQTSLSEDRFTRTGATTNGYLTAAKSGDVWTTTWNSSSKHGCSDYIDIHDATKLTVGCDVTANLVYFDENKVCCGNFVGNGSFTAKTTIPPAGAYYARMNYDTRYIASSSLIVYFNVNTYNLNPIVAISPDSITALKPLSGLKVAWYGTSIPHGYPYQNTNQDTYSYANRAVTELGGIIQNRCVSGGFIISATNTADTHNQTSRFTDIDPEGTYYSPVNYQTKIIDLIGTADEPDIFVFDWGANDGQFYQSYFNGINLDTVDITSEDIKTFIGAYNTIIKALLTAKPKARIFLVTHYSDDGQSNEMTRKDGYRTMNRLIEKIADYWHIPCNSVYKKTGWIYNRNGISNIRSQWCKDGIHPANSANVESIKFLTKIHKQFLMENYYY